MYRLISVHRWIGPLLLTLLIGLIPVQAQDGGPSDVEHLGVIAIYEHDLMAGPLGTGAYLAPTGDLFAHLNVNNHIICIWTIQGEQQNCASLPDPTYGIDTETVRWSPDSRYIVITNETPRHFEDTDLWLMNASDGSMVNLTDDGVEGELFSPEVIASATVDRAPHWSADGERVLFVRYLAGQESSRTALFMSIKPDGSDLQTIGQVEFEVGYSVTGFDRSVDGSAFVYSYIPPDLDSPDKGVWIAGGALENPQWLGLWEYIPPGTTEIMTLPPWWAEFSPDGTYVLLRADQILNYSDDIYFDAAAQKLDPLASPVRFIALADRSAFYADEGVFVHSAGWAPFGQAFAYLVSDRKFLSAENGLYLSSGPGQPGRLVLPGLFQPPTLYGRQPLEWADNNTILLSKSPEDGIVIVQLGETP